MFEFAFSHTHSGHPLLYCAKFGWPLRVKLEMFQTGENEGRAGSILRLQESASL